MSVCLFSVWSWICSASGKISPDLLLGSPHMTTGQTSDDNLIYRLFPTADVILDSMTNHLWLQVSDDQRMVQEGIKPAELPDNPQRFDSWPCVLAWEGYSSGRHYWEVDIANHGYWRVGLTTAVSKRQGRFPMNPKQGFWTLWRSTHDFFACTKPETQLPVGLVPQRMGIYLDYEEGQISFYNAETKTHIYTFTGTFRETLYPLFAPLDGRTLMRIMPPHDISNWQRRSSMSFIGHVKESN